MARQFSDQGGASSSEPSRLRRWVTSRMMRRMADPARRQRRRLKLEKERRKAGESHVIEYFHQANDPYSYLAAQLLQPVLDAYDVVLMPHLVHEPSGKNAPEPELLLEYACSDCGLLAPHYQLEFPRDATPPGVADTELATRILATAQSANFPRIATGVGEALWRGGEQLQEVGRRLGVASEETAHQKIVSGTARRAELGHYSGAMFYYAGEWYWGVDRLYHLENRLIELGARRDGEKIPLARRPEIDAGARRDTGSLTLEFYPSLRSPYTSIIFDRTLQLAQDTGVNLYVRPVLPMVMRGVPATLEKGRYIMSDTAREGETLGLCWGNVCDPIGEPVRRAYSLYPWACGQGKGNALLGSFLQAAFFQGINTNTDAGLQKVVEEAGLDWPQARTLLGNTDWEDAIEENRLAMYGFGCWGVPSYRLLDKDGEVLLALWGQDRLWLVARHIQQAMERQLASE
jgi:2-hydroxychromene-2-carboxylate isomerase